MSVEKNISLNKQTSRVLALLALVEKQLDSLITAFIKKDIKKANEIQANDLNVNIEFRYILDKSTWILTQHVFLGEELRRLLSYNNIAKEFERLGDVIASVAKYLVDSNMKMQAKKEFLNGLTQVRGRLKNLRKIIFNPTEADIIETLKYKEGQTNAYRETKKFYIKKMATTTDPKLVETYLKEIRLMIRIDRMSVYISNAYEYLMFTLTSRSVVLSFSQGDD